jgi:hypothetical protein
VRGKEDGVKALARPSDRLICGCGVSILDIQREEQELYMLEKDFAFFNAHRDAFNRDHSNEFVVIKDETVVGFYKSQMDAFIAMKSAELGSFLVKQCIPADQDIIEYHTRRIAFA